MNKYGFLQNYNAYLMNQENKEIAKGIPVFKDIAENESMWFVKLSGYQLLNGLQSHYTKESSTLETSIESFEAEGNAMKAADSKKDLNFCKVKITEISSILNTLKQNETDGNMKKYLGIK